MGNKDRKITAYLSPASDDVIGNCNHLSSRLNAIIARYGCIVRDSMPAMSRNQWCAIMDANNGTDLLADRITPMIVWANVHDTPGLGEKWGIDQAALVSDLQQLSTTELLAVQEACVRFWQAAELPTDEALALSWARIS